MTDSKLKVGIVTGSTRPGRKAEAVAQWVLDIANTRGDADFELVDIASFNLPLLDEPAPPSMGEYQHNHTKAWAHKIASLDAFIFVTPEYNHGTSAALKNALDFIYAEWNNKSAGFVGYGTVGGSRAIEHLRGHMGELQVADVRAQVNLTLAEDFEHWTVLKPRTQHAGAVNTLLNQVVGWGKALKAAYRP
ncbi:NADPH-dependent FMN reductase [Mesorhizobium muleiense]|uniref:NADPH-dependent FMN reductase n=1 Tax=Mesorhizobium muleiense TaxID=1004279 RepID=UPI001F302440|nr:NAD(P)H-dependent oxidoreductase [Mesorhizobium muleiense]MCF6112156.1 NAD(P)H-dependent oxidoreductase [Mesorhizobium muleiense]